MNLATRFKCGRCCNREVTNMSPDIEKMRAFGEKGSKKAKSVTLITPRPHKALDSISKIHTKTRPSDRPRPRGSSANA